jgi:hypothetical protein
MATEGAANRWWENYLVRYLMPSIAGVVIVSWLSDIAGNDFSRLLFLPVPPDKLDATRLTLLFLYGNLFCYVASFPVLCFHATRAVDYGLSKSRWLWWVNGYAVTLVIGAVAWIISTAVPPPQRAWTARLLVVIFSAVQCIRRWAYDRVVAGDAPLPDGSNVMRTYTYAYIRN